MRKRGELAGLHGRFAAPGHAGAGIDARRAQHGPRDVAEADPHAGAPSAGGQAGVAKAIDILGKEMLTTMGLCGVNTIAEIDDNLLAV